MVLPTREPKGTLATSVMLLLNLLLLITPREIWLKPEFVAYTCMNTVLCIMQMYFLLALCCQVGDSTLRLVPGINVIKSLRVLSNYMETASTDIVASLLYYTCLSSSLITF